MCVGTVSGGFRSHWAEINVLTTHKAAAVVLARAADAVLQGP